MISWNKAHKWFYWVVAIVSLLLGLIGVVLPVLPTTPFLILSLWAASKCSPKMASWIASHPKFGSVIQSWQAHRAIPLMAKCLATMMMLISVFLLWYKGYEPTILGAVVVVIALILIYVWSKPNH